MTIRAIRAGEHVQHIPGWGMTVRESGVAVATSNWWVVAGRTCVVAYQPKGAATYAASLVNLANPGTYDAVEVDAPSWGASTGWTFAGPDRLTTVQLGATTWTLIVRVNIADAGGGNAGRALDADGTPLDMFLIPYNATGPAVSYQHFGVTLTVSPNVTGDNVLAIADRAAYRNGTAEDTALPNATGSAVAVTSIGNRTDGTRNLGGAILAFAIYSDTLTTGEVSARTAAMAAL